MARMKIFKPTLYVGLGGTGLRIGMQLEQSLRSELCGSNGRALLNRGFSRTLEPYELPRCVQFVYLDFDEADRANAQQASMAVAGQAAAASTAQVVGNLAPTQDSYAFAAESLRIGASDAVRTWLPPKDGEPQKAPLSAGAGQLPTVGRAALFETFRAADGPRPVTQPLKDAFARLAESIGELNAIAGDRAQTGYDVFVGFSVAGGTGAGIFYDVLRLIGHVADKHFRDADTAIYPLVVMPSAFGDEADGTNARDLQLNGGPALKELFELVDLHHTNPNALQSTQTVSYPGHADALVNSKVPAKTAFLFSRPATLTIEDLHRSIVAFILSTIGTTVQAETGDEYRPLTSRLINSQLLGAKAPDGIGQHPATTALAAELRIPLEDIVEILAQRLLANAVRDLAQPEPNEEADNRRLFQRFGAVSGLDILANPAPEHQLPAVEARGAQELTKELQRRAAKAVALLKTLRSSLEPRMAVLAAEANYAGAIEALAAEHDFFRIARVALGHRDFSDGIVRDGFRGAIARRGQEPPGNPNNFTDAPPPIPPLHNSLLGRRKLGPDDKTVRAVVAQQDEWYRWRVAKEYHEVWKRQQESWEPRLRDMQDRILELVGVFEDQAATEPSEFQDACQKLYRERTGVVYFLPDGGPQSDLNSWYETAVLPRLREVVGASKDARERVILSKVMYGRWQAAYNQTGRRAAVEGPREFVLDAIRKTLTDQVLAAGDENSLMPRIETLLRTAAHQSEQAPAEISQRLLDIFKVSLQQLLPIDFRPRGLSDADSGQLMIDVFYPAAQSDARIESFLSSTALASISQQNRSFHALGGVDFLSVVLRREALSATALDEYKQMMNLRAEVLGGNARPGDLLKWRQRRGYMPDSLILRDDEGPGVLGALLTALWDGSIIVSDGTDENPRTLRIYQQDEAAGAPIELELADDVPSMSSWADLLFAYERYVLAGDQQARARCQALLARRAPSSSTPSDLYRTFMGLREEEQRKATQLKEQLAKQDRARGNGWVSPTPRAYSFWCQQLPAAEVYNREDPSWATLELDNRGDLGLPVV